MIVYKYRGYNTNIKNSCSCLYLSIVFSDYNPISCRAANTISGYCIRNVLPLESVKSDWVEWELKEGQAYLHNEKCEGALTSCQTKQLPLTVERKTRKGKCLLMLHKHGASAKNRIVLKSFLALV